MQALNISEFEQAIKEDTIIIDTRAATTFTLGFIPGSISIGHNGKWSEWAEQLIPKDKHILLVTPQDVEVETVNAWKALGYKSIDGYLQGGYEHWQEAGKPIDMIIDITADELALDIPFDEKLSIIDVRTEEEFDAAHVKDAENFPLAALTDTFQIAQLDEEANMYVYCGGGYRSVIACSIMKKEGFHNVRNILGGFAAIKDTPNLAIEVPKKK